MGCQSRVDILLATYNGARWLPRQIESILPQLRPGYRLLVRDDGSSDETLSILKKYAADTGGAVVLLENGDGNLGACGSYARLLEHAEADYVVFCDQDDVWLPGRISRPLKRIRALERQCGTQTPVLVHTDLVVVDQGLRRQASSFWKYSHIDPRRGSALNRLLVQNVVTGCATTINRALARLARPIPAEALMHDWWLALIAAAFGRIDYLPEPTVLYRQHTRNQVGAKRWSCSYVLRRALSLLNRKRVVRHVHDLREQAAVFFARFRGDLGPQQASVVQALLDLETDPFLAKRRRVLHYGLSSVSWIRTVGWLMMI